MLIMGNQDFVEAYEAQYGELGHVRFYLECTAVDWEVRTRVVTRTIIGIRRIARKEREGPKKKTKTTREAAKHRQCM
jgi:hypothetical protein